MTHRVLTRLGCLLVVVSCGTPTPEPGATGSGFAAATVTGSGPALLALHLYNPASAEAHEDFLDGLGWLNSVVAKAGHPETRYTVWKVTGEQSGSRGYLAGSIWADQATYDAVHAAETYTTAVAVLGAAGTEPMRGEVYNRYVQLSPAATDPAAMPGAGPMLLSLHRFNLPSAELEGELIALLEDVNGAVAAAGHPETRYSVWKITGEQVGDLAYLFASAWASRAAYDEVHANPIYQAVTERHAAALEALVMDEIYNRYEFVGPR